MAVKTSAAITLASVIDVKATYRYYLLQSSTLAAPSKPTVYPPSSWTSTEPSYTEGSTNSLYFVDCTVFCDDTFQYSAVSRSTSYEAAKAAYNKAQTAQTTASNAAKTATNHLSYDNTNGLLIGNKSSGSWSGYKAQILPTAFNILDESGDILASYGETIKLGDATLEHKTIDFINGPEDGEFLTLSANDAMLYGNESASMFVQGTASEFWTYLTMDGNEVFMQAAQYDNDANGRPYYAGADLTLTAHEGQYSEIIGSADVITLTGRNRIALSGEVSVTGTINQNGTAVSLVGHTHSEYATVGHEHSYLPLNGGNLTGHVYLTGAKASSSTGSTSQLVFGTSSSNHVVLSSNTGALVINPSTASSVNQIVLYLNQASKFPKGIEGNCSSATKATQDGNGNVIASTYLKLSGGTINGSLTATEGNFTNLYKGGKAVATTDHTHDWVSVAPTAGADCTLDSVVCKYNAALKIAYLKLTVNYSPTADVSAGTAITFAYVKGQMIPDHTLAVSIHANSTNSRRWMGAITDAGAVRLRASSAVTAGNTYTVYITAMYMCDGL